MLQVQSEDGTRPENYIVRGMNKKMNYFVSKHQIYDLEFNIPFQTSSNSYQMNKSLINHNLEQTKIYQDSSRSLGIDEPNILNFPATRMNLEFWKNINELGEKADFIERNSTLE